MSEDGKIQKVSDRKILTGGPLVLDHILYMTEGGYHAEMLELSALRCFLARSIVKGTGTLRGLVVFNQASYAVAPQIKCGTRLCLIMDNSKDCP